MKVLQINAVNRIRSTGRNCFEIAEYLNENGHECYIAYSSGQFYKKGYRIGNIIDSKFHGIMSRLTGKQAYFSRHHTKLLLNYMNYIKPDIVHLNNLHANFINLGLLLSYLAKHAVPTVITLHDCWFYTGKCTHYTLDRCNRWTEHCGNCPRLHKDNPSWFFDRTSKMLIDKKKWFSKIPNLAVIGVSDWITEEARLSILSSAKIIKKIYNWIDLDIFKPLSSDSLKEKLGLIGQFVVLGVASGWSNAKGLDKFIEISSSLPDDVSIILIGNIKNSIQLPQNIIHVKETHDVREMTRYYSVADVLLNLSIEESFGKVCAEALACGTPVIALSSTANPELVGVGCGYVIENYNKQGVVDRIMQIKKQGKESYSYECMKFAKENFDKSARIKDHINLYSQIATIETRQYNIR